MLMGIMIYELDKPTKPVSVFRKRLRKFLNHLNKHEKTIYDKCMAKTNEVWAKVTLEYDKKPDVKLLVSQTLLSLSVFVDDVKWVKKIYTQRVFDEMYNSLIHNAKHSHIGSEVETGKLVDRLAFHIGLVSDKRTKLSEMFKRIKNES